MYHVKEVNFPVPGNLDLNIADEDEFSPDKLRSGVERLYMTVVCVYAIPQTNHNAHPLRDNRLHWLRQAHCSSSVLARTAPDGVILHRQ